jgi:hypothetical protein
MATSRQQRYLPTGTPAVLPRRMATMRPDRRVERHNFFNDNCRFDCGAFFFPQAAIDDFSSEMRPYCYTTQSLRNPLCRQDY